MHFLILRLLKHSELGMFHEYRRQGKEGSKQRAINFDWDVVDRVFPTAKDTDIIELDLRYDTDNGVATIRQQLSRQEKNWRLEGNCPIDVCYSFVEPGCLFAMDIDSGRNPAQGAWAVFPANDPVTKAVLANGESSRLARSSMIALHDDEGSQVWEILAGARPDLFSAPHTASSSPSESAMTTTPEPAAPGRKKLPPEAARLVEMLASVGHTMPSAVADLVDNAINADATSIDITFGKPNEGHGRWLTIIDNGHGMSPDQLDEAMRLGGKSDYSGNSLGKYGFGLKGASWSQAKVFTVITKEDGKPAHHQTWDIDDMEDWAVKLDPLDPWEQGVTALSKHGTAVLWKDMKPPQSIPTLKGLDPYSSEVAALERHLALVFHRFIEGKAKGRKPVAIRINGTPIEPNDPVGHPLTKAYDAKVIKIPTDTQHGLVQAQAFLLPHEDELNTHHKPEGSEGIKRAIDRIGMYGKRNESQGLYIYRHDRLIKWGGWAQIWETNDEKTKLARVTVDFDKVLDDPFKINISKQSVQLPQQLQAELKKLADVARKDSQKKYLKPKSPPAPAPAPVPGGKTSTTGGGSTGGAGGATGATTGTGGGAPLPKPTGTPAPLPPSGPKVAVKAVKTDKFVWKLSKSLTGSVDVQISDLEINLAELVKQIGPNAQALSHLAGFLGALDSTDVQQKLLARLQPATVKEA